MTDSNPASVPSGAQGVFLVARSDVDYGTVSYGQFLGPWWKEVRYGLDQTQADVPQPGTATPFTSGGFSSYEAMPADDEIVPVLGPPRSPKIQGRDSPPTPRPGTSSIVRPSAREFPALPPTA